MIGMERIDAVGKRIGDMSIGDTFTSTGRYIPGHDPVWKIEQIISDCYGTIVECVDLEGWHTHFEIDAIVYPV